MIRATGVTKRFGDQSVLDGVSLEVPTGETVAVLGRSGTGKSVLLKQVAGLLEPDAGEIWIGEERLTGAPRSRVMRLRLRMGYVFQFGALFDSMTVAENVAMALRRHLVPEGEIASRVTVALETVGLSGEGSRLPAELSGGMRKRAAVARAVVARPDYLLYDEPTTGLDPVTKGMIDELMLRLKRELRATSLLVTHDLRSAFRVADRIAMLSEGRIRQVGTPEEIQASEDPAVRAFLEGRRDVWPRPGETR
ncbi:MAG: ABC transporter ATP-binding protein [Gemmatimonadota bacterium]